MTDTPERAPDPLEAAAKHIADEWRSRVSWLERRSLRDLDERLVRVMKHYGLRGPALKHHEHPTCSWSLLGDGTFRCTRPEGHNGLHSVVFGDDEHFRSAPAPDPGRAALVERLELQVEHLDGGYGPRPAYTIQLLREAARALAAPAEREPAAWMVEVKFPDGWRDGGTHPERHAADRSAEEWRKQCPARVVPLYRGPLPPAPERQEEQDG